MNIEDVLEFYGNCALAAQAINTTKQNINNWKKRGQIPMVCQLKYELNSKGALKAGAAPRIKKYTGFKFEYQNPKGKIYPVVRIDFQPDNQLEITYKDDKNVLCKGYKFENLIIKK